MSDVVGMPDDEDKKNIQKIIDDYERDNPGDIQELIDYGKAHAKSDFNLVGETSNRRYILELPPKLHAKLEEYIPTIFRDQKHFAWFCKNFKQLTIPEKY